MNIFSNGKHTKNIFLFLLAIPIIALACQTLTPEITFDMNAETEQVLPTQGPEPQTTAGTSPILPPISGTEEEVLIALYERYNTAVVNITTYLQQGDTLFASGQGSGFVYDANGHIVTNAHVVQDAAQVEVTFSDGSGSIAEVVGEDPHSDLAVVKVEKMPENVIPLSMGSMDDLAVGQTVIAIGNPFGLEGTLTRGVISALGRSIPALTSFSIPQAIQTDAAINPGNSGGPLMSLSGEVIGVNAQIETDGQSDSNLGIGFAIPVSIVRVVVPALIENGEYNWAWLGVRGGDVDPILVEAMSLEIDKGAYLVEVDSRGPAAKAGLRGADDVAVVQGRQVEVGGDVITAINGEPVHSFDDLLIYISLNSQPGQTVTLTVLRDGRQSEFDVRLEQRPSNLNLEP